MDIKAINNLMDASLVQGGSKAEIHYQNSQNIRPEGNNIQDESKNISDDLKKLNKEQIENLFKDIKEKFDYMNKYLKIEIDKDLHEPVVKIIDKRTNEVIRQIPPEYLLDLAKKIDKLVGLLFSKEV